jgi:hypothetical protein
MTDQRQPEKAMRPIIIFLFILSVMFFSCESIPPGEPPEGPLAEPIEEPINLKKDKTEKDALNFMFASIASRCVPVVSGASAPKVWNDFIISENGRLNYLPMELWNNISRRNLIKPETEKKDAEYILVSEFRGLEPKSEEKSEKKIFSWKLKMLSAADMFPVWEDEINFFIEK